MRAEKKRAESMERTKQCKKVYNTNHRPIKPDTLAPYPKNSMFKVATNIGTGTVDYWPWIMDQELRATCGQ